MSYNTSFHWPAGPSNVVVTGTFDNWTQSLPLVKTAAGDFEITLPLKPEHSGDEKILFKFVVDGEWTTSEQYEIENDSGNVNNVLYFSNLAAAAAAQEESSGSKIPEAGGLVAASAPAPTATETETKTEPESAPVTAESEKTVDTTVLPSEEGKQVTSGEPGIVVPENAAEIKEFSEVSEVNAKDLNETIKAEEAAEAAAATNGEFSTTVLPSTEGVQETSATGEPGVVIPENAAEIKEFSEVSEVDPKSLNETINAEEAEEKKTTKSVAVKKTIKRNKLTGEEIVVSSVPIEETKTLDPKVTADAPAAASPAPAAATPAAPAAPSTPSTPVKKTTPTPAATSAKKVVSTPVKEEKKKGGFFRKLKNAFN